MDDPVFEQTLVMIKPDHVEVADVVLGELDRWGDRRFTCCVDAVLREVIEEHYAVHRGKPFFDYLTQSFVGRRVVLARYTGQGVIRKIRDAAGPTDPAKDRTKIRGRYSADSLEEAMAEGRPVRNVVHCSESPKEAMREMEIWRRYLEE